MKRNTLILNIVTFLFILVGFLLIISPAYGGEPMIQRAFKELFSFETFNEITTTLLIFFIAGLVVLIAHIVLIVYRKKYLNFIVSANWFLLIFTSIIFIGGTEILKEFFNGKIKNILNEQIAGMVFLLIAFVLTIMAMSYSLYVLIKNNDYSIEELNNQKNSTLVINENIEEEIASNNTNVVNEIHDNTINNKGVESMEVEKSTEKKDTTKVYHVNKRAVDKKRTIKFANGSKVIKLFNTKEEAVTYAEELAKNQGGIVLVHASKGKNKGKIQKQ